MYQMHQKIIEEIIKEKHPTANIKIQPIGPVIGAHCGPDTLAVVYYGKQRVIPLKDAE